MYGQVSIKEISWKTTGCVLEKEYKPEKILYLIMSFIKKGKKKFIEDTLYFYRIKELSVTKLKSNNEKVLESHLLCAEIVKHYFESETIKDPRTKGDVFSGKQNRIGYRKAVLKKSSRQLFRYYQLSSFNFN